MSTKVEIELAGSSPGLCLVEVKEYIADLFKSTGPHPISARWKSAVTVPKENGILTIVFEFFELDDIATLVKLRFG